MFKYKFTIFTPTYNRERTLTRVFESLKSQNIDHKYFEWIIIDDGSTDNTKEKIDNFIENASYKIKYYYQKNQGKHICYNKAIDIAEGELFLILDSDDEIVNNCLETFWNHWETLSKKTKDELYCINCLCKDGYTNKRIGFELEEGLFQDAFKWRYANKITFDTWGAVSTKIFREYKYPCIKNMQFIPESYLWDRVSINKSILSLNKVLKIVYYQKDGFSRNIIESYKKHSKGMYIYFLMAINDLSHLLFKYDKVRFIKNFIQLGRIGLHNKLTYFQISKEINSTLKKIVFVILFPISYFLYTKDNIN